MTPLLVSILGSEKMRSNDAKENKRKLNFVIININFHRQFQYLLKINFILVCNKVECISIQQKKKLACVSSGKRRSTPTDKRIIDIGIKG